MSNDNLNTTLEAIDKFIAEKHEAINLGKKLERLMGNQDFQDVILNGYIEAESQLLFNVLTTPTDKELDESLILQKLQSIRDLKGYVGAGDYPCAIKIEAERAPLDIAGEEEERQRVTAEASGE